MLFQRITRTGPEKIFAICRNTEASAEMFDGEVVVFSTSVAVGTVLGSSVLKATAAFQPTVAGVVSSRGISGTGNGIAADDFGPIQIYGYHDRVKTTAAALAVGTVVTTDAAAAAVIRAVAVVGDIDDQELGVCLKLGVANRAGILIKCM